MTFYELYQYYKNRGKETGEGIESITDTTQYIPIPPREGGGGDGPQGDFGKFGNLDKSSAKTFNKEVWGVGGPANMYSGWENKDVVGYKNVNTGLYQTEAGKNINHLGIEIPTIAGMLFDKNFGKGPQIGDIKGTFTDGFPTGWKNTMKGWKESISNIGNPFKNTIHDPDLKEDENWENVTYDASKNITTDTTPPNPHTNPNLQADGSPAYSPTGEGNTTPGIGWNDTGGVVSNRTGRGRTDWSQGGRIGYEKGSNGMLEVDAYSALLKNVDAVSEKVGIPSAILQEHSDWENDKASRFETMQEYDAWLDTNYPKSPIGTYLYHLPTEEKMDMLEKISVNKAQGGRIGFFGGGDYKEYWKMVTDMYIQSGSEEGTGMSLTAFADKYFKKREGGIMTIPTQLHG